MKVGFTFILLVLNISPKNYFYVFKKFVAQLCAPKIKVQIEGLIGELCSPLIGYVSGWFSPCSVFFRTSCAAKDFVSGGFPRAVSRQPSAVERTFKMNVSESMLKPITFLCRFVSSRS